LVGVGLLSHLVSIWATWAIPVDRVHTTTGTTVLASTIPTAVGDGTHSTIEPVNMVVATGTMERDLRGQAGGTMAAGIAAEIVEARPMTGITMPVAAGTVLVLGLDHRPIVMGTSGMVLE
jgi:hypothetical protein